jgi:hypothetical protein
MNKLGIFAYFSEEVLLLDKDQPILYISKSYFFSAKSNREPIRRNYISRLGITVEIII